MRSWQRRMAAADRRFSFQAATADQPETDLEQVEVSGSIGSSTVTLSAASDPAPSAATQLAELLRAGVAAGEPPAVLVARSA
jgi:hypothetical protein